MKRGGDGKGWGGGFSRQGRFESCNNGVIEKKKGNGRF